MIGYNNFLNPFFEGLYIIDESPMISANHLSDSLGCLQIAALNSCNQLFYIAVILTKYGRIQYMFPVDIPIVQLCLHTILKRGHPQVRKRFLYMESL